MKNITMIAAVGKNLELGKNNQLIWHLKKDLQFFKNQTIHKPIVMGSKTFYSLPKLLPERKHIILTRQNLTLPEEVQIVHSKEELLEYIKNLNQEVMIIGGASIYSQLLNDADKMILTEIDAEDKEADAFFPKYNKEDWIQELLEEEQEKDISYKHLVYTRKK